MSNCYSANIWQPVRSEMLDCALHATALGVRFRCETLDWTLHPVARAIGFYRINGVVVSCPRLEVVHTHAENGRGMTRVQPDGRLCCLAEVRRSRAVMYDTIMLGRPTGVVACPPDNCKIGIYTFHLRPLSDPHARGFPC